MWTRDFLWVLYSCPIWTRDFVLVYELYGENGCGQGRGHLGPDTGTKFWVLDVLVVMPSIVDDGGDGNDGNDRGRSGIEEVIRVVVCGFLGSWKKRYEELSLNRRLVSKF
ncbi:putative leucine-rich repeat extensin-like protein 2 [Iris pallida]|uniref:Leucine-rich repeat extensin-like protein 2 n=1 Tax=Iris pallida TaxID=29817 RepID=A0AAX6ENZ2_IRIPA|nr:putative leucine-rich repeat extensin-like protein 2 [Iris pallida]